MLRVEFVGQATSLDSIEGWGLRTTMTDSPAYLSHTVLATLNRYAEFYEYLSTLVSGFVSGGTTVVTSIDSFLYQSIGGTLRSVKLIIREGRMNDGYALLRKYFDSVTLSLYVDLYLNDRRGEGAVREVNDWLRGAKPLPKDSFMRTYVANSCRLEPVIGMLLKKDHPYKAIRDRCNGHMHYGDFRSVLLNDTDVPVDRLTVLDQLENDVADLFVLHLACVFFMNGHYMMASEYMDSVDSGMEPEADSQYRVDPFVQEIFDEVLQVRRPDVCAAIRSHTSMHLA